VPLKSALKPISRNSSWLGPSISPGEMLLEEFLYPRRMSQVEAARRLGVSLSRVNGIVLEKRRVNADMALRLAKLLKTSPQFWMHLQADWDLHQAIERASRRAP
jgi:addiction module HigA family antidote